MSDKTYALPGMADWTFNSPTLRHKGGAGFRVTTATTAQEIGEAVKNILRGTTLTPDEVAFQAVAQAALNIDWHAMLGPYPVAVAPLINPAPTIAVQKADNAAQIDAICLHLETAYYAIKKL